MKPRVLQVFEPGKQRLFLYGGFQGFLEKKMLLEKKKSRCYNFDII